MAVVINEMEVEPAEAAPPPPAAAPSGGGGGGGESPPSEHELQRLVEHRFSRDERVWAH
ncbi:MAG TPA: hypothetical protein VIW64_13315 [Pyrinomonadaceae bacterium]